MDLKRLRTFICLAELGSLTRAADQLRIAQPALSRQIRLLEEEVGMPLFNRHSRGMTLTEAGAELLKFAAGPLRQLELSIVEARAVETRVAGRVALGMMPSTTGILARRIAERAAAEFPDVALRIAEGYVRHLTEWLKRGEIDVSLGYAPALSREVKTTDLLEEEMLLIGPAKAKLSLNKGIPCRELGSFRLVLPSAPNGLRALVESAAADLGLHLNVWVDADSYIVLKDLVARGHGHTVLPMSAVAEDLKAKRLSAAPLIGPALTRKLILMEPAHRAPSRATRAIIALILDEIGALIRSGIWPGVPAAETKPALRGEAASSPSRTKSLATLDSRL